MFPLPQLFVPVLMLGLTGPAAADDLAARGPWCQENPAKCEEMRARREEFCKKNPQTCEQKQKERAARKQWCQDNPAECEQMKAEKRARVERIREKCDADPAACEKRRAAMRERRHERSEAFCAEYPEKCDGKTD